MKFLGASAAIFVAGQVGAATVDFEDFGTTYMSGGGSGICAGQGNDECNIFGAEFAGDGITLSFSNVSPIYDNQLKIVRVGSPTDGFVPSDTPIPEGIFGDFFMTTEFHDNTHFSLSFDRASDVSFQIADIDGDSHDGSGKLASQLEMFQITSYLFGGGTEIVIVSGDGTLLGDTSATDGVVGDAEVTSFAFMNTTRVDILGTTTGGSRNIGYGLDNIEFAAAVPLPAGLPLLLAGLGALGLVGRRRRRS